MRARGREGARVGRLTVLAVAFTVTAACSFAQNCPAKPIRLVLPVAPGGGSDGIVRVVTQKLTAAIGQLRAIAVTSARRSALLPEISTIAEQGYPGFEVSGWYGMLAPAGKIGRAHV